MASCRCRGTACRTLLPLPEPEKGRASPTPTGRRTAVRDRQLFVDGRRLVGQRRAAEFPTRVTPRYPTPILCSALVTRHLPLATASRSSPASTSYCPSSAYKWPDAGRHEKVRQRSKIAPFCCHSTCAFPCRPTRRSVAPCRDAVPQYIAFPSGAQAEGTEAGPTFHPDVTFRPPVQCNRRMCPSASPIFSNAKREPSGDGVA